MTSRIPISDPVIIGGATKSTMTELTSMLNSSSINATPFFFSDRMPFATKYDSTPGADRVAGMLYCATQFPEVDCIMISAGTAITINVLFKNEFLGGAIFPGVSTQLRSLTLYAPVLPSVSPDGSVPLPGSSTETCIRSGVLYGIAGGIERIIREYQSTFDTDFVVCACGGDWPYLHRFFDMTIRHDPDMILSGLALGRVYL
jgi:type III pantothenate kinase